MKKVFLFLISISFLNSCSKPNPADYIKDIVVHQEGPDGLITYVVLADQSGTPTATDGKLTLTIESVDEDKVHYPQFDSTYTITSKDFSKQSTGLGPLNVEVLSFTPGRIKYADFLMYDTFRDQIQAHGRGRVVIKVAPSNGKPMDAVKEFTF